MKLWRRMARLLTQSRIRLPRRPLSAEELRPGDRIRLCSTSFRVVTRRYEPHRVVFRLCSLEGGESALLTRSRQAPGPWTLEERGTRISVPPELLLVFLLGERRVVPRDY